jgi:hypothetical protein
MTGFGLPAGAQSVWYFSGAIGAGLKFMKLIPSARFVNVDS